MSMDTIKSFQLAVSNLRGHTIDQYSLDTSNTNEMEFLKVCLERNTASACYLLILKAQILYLAGDNQQALEKMLIAKRILIYIRGTCAVAEYNFFYSLILCALLPNADKQQQSEYFLQLEENQLQMKMWMDNCNENFQHKYLLVAAQIAELAN